MMMNKIISHCLMCASFFLFLFFIIVAYISTFIAMIFKSNLFKKNNL